MASSVMQILSIKDAGEGEFEGVKYHNVTLYCVKPVPDKGILFGPSIEVIKFKAEDFYSAAEREIANLKNPAVKSVNDLEGLLIRPFYTKFGGKGIVYNADDFLLSLGETERNLFPKTLPTSPTKRNSNLSPKR